MAKCAKNAKTSQKMTKHAKQDNFLSKSKVPTMKFQTKTHFAI